MQLLLEGWLLMVDFSPAPDHTPVNGGHAFSVTTDTPSDLRLDQFAFELANAHGWDWPPNMNYIAGGDIEGYILQIEADDVDLTKLAAVGRAHKRNDGFAMPDQGNRKPPPVTPPRRPTP